MNPRIIFGPFEPDKPPHLSDALNGLVNAYPRANGYAPVGDFSEVAPTLGSDFMGGVAYVASDGSSTLIGATATALRKYSGGAWVDLATGLSGGRWDFTQFGDIAIAVNGGPTQAVDLTAGTAAALAGSPPTAKSVATVRDFVMYGQANGDQTLVQWCGFNDPTSNTPGTDQAGFQPMQAGGAVQGICGGEYGVVVQRRRIVRATSLGFEPWFQFDAVTDEVGAVSAGSIAQSEKTVFFLSDRGFMKFDGNEATPIGKERVDTTFFGLHPRQTLDQMWSAIDPRRSVVGWLMPGNPGRMWIYDWQLGKWSTIVIPALGLFSGFTANTSLDALDVPYPSLDAMPYSLDDPRFAGGDPLFILADRSSAFGTLSGANLAASFLTGFTEFVDRRRARMRAVVPLGDVTGGATLSLDMRQRLGDAAAARVSSTLRASGQMPVRANGIYAAAQFDIAAGEDWSFMQGLEFIPAVGGAR